MNSIRDLRISIGMSQKDLARRAGIDARTLRKIENGEPVSELSKAAVERVLGADAIIAPKATPSPEKTCFSDDLILLVTAAAVFAMLFLGGASLHLAVGGTAIIMMFTFAACASYALAPARSGTRASRLPRKA